MGVIPSRYPPPVDPAIEFIGAPSDPESERIEVGVAIVGASPAGLACANRLAQLLEREPELAEMLGEVPVAVIEKGRVPGAHELSGAIMRPSAFVRLWPELPEDQWPTYGKVRAEGVYVMLSARRSLRIPTPPPFKNQGNHIVSIAELTRWMGERAEEARVYILPETSAQRLLVQDGVVRGVRSGDKGRGRSGERLGNFEPNFEPGSDVIARITVLADGVWGRLTGAAISAFGLGSGDPPVWSLGVKEVWKVPKPLRRVIYTLGWPLRTAARYREFGGSWIYPMGEDRVSIGFVVGLDYADLTLSVHDILQQFKLHPRIRGILEGGRRIA